MSRHVIERVGFTTLNPFIVRTWRLEHPDFSWDGSALTTSTIRYGIDRTLRSDGCGQSKALYREVPSFVSYSILSKVKLINLVCSRQCYRSSGRTAGGSCLFGSYNPYESEEPQQGVQGLIQSPFMRLQTTELDPGCDTGAALLTVQKLVHLVYRRVELVVPTCTSVA